MWNLKKSAAVAALAAAVSVSACDRDDRGSLLDPGEGEPVYAALDSTFASNPNRTFIQVERLGNPLAMEVPVAKREHQFHDNVMPSRDPGHFTDDYVEFITIVAGRSEAYARVIAGAILGQVGRDPGDKIRVFPNRAAGVTAATLATTANPNVGWLTQVLNPTTGFGGRTVPEDVVDIGAGAIFGSLAGNTMNVSLGLTRDNVDSNDKAPLNTFPYLPTPTP